MRTTVSAGIHATAAAVAYIFRSRVIQNASDSPEGNCTPTPAAPGSALRALTLMDCPELPPLAILRVMSIVSTSISGASRVDGCVDGGLEHLTLGYSTTPPMLEPSLVEGTLYSISHGYAGGVDHSRRRRHPPRAGRAAAGGAGGGSSRVDGGEAETPEAFDIGQVDGVGRNEEETRGCDGEGENARAQEEVDHDVSEDLFGEGGVTIEAPSTLKSLTVAGEGGLTELDLGRCSRLRTLEVVRCRQLR